MIQYCRYCIHSNGDPDRHGLGYCDAQTPDKAALKKTYRRNACCFFSFNEVDAWGYERGITDPLKAIYRPREPKNEDCEGQMTLDECLAEMEGDLISRRAAMRALEEVAGMHPYKVPGQRDTYDTYNEAWQDCIDRAEGAIWSLPPARKERAG